jgi:periplasmic divalent cation tolerance protein
MVTAPNIMTGRKIATAVLTERLVACVNLLPKIESHYWWQGQLESSSEVLMLMKTTAKHLRELEQLVIKEHPYNTPEFVSLKLDDGNEKYLTWVRSSTEKPN